MNSPFAPCGLPTAIGSFPHAAPAEAVDLMLRRLDQAPVWPQLPQRGFLETMCPQYSQGLPGLVVDRAAERIYFRIGDDFLARLEAFYARVIEEDLDYFGLSPDHAAGFHHLIDRLGQAGRRFPFLKGQVTGPVTFALTNTDADRRPAFYRPELADAIVKALALNARWQIRRLKPFADRVIIFIDEPYLSSVGSAVIALKAEDARGKIDEVAAAVHAEGALAGVHCCANTDWSILAGSSVDIISFDAYGYAKNLLLYAAAIKKFLDRGGCLAWGIVPSSPEADQETGETLFSRLSESFGKLSSAGIAPETILRQSLITPSCGMGTLAPSLSDRILGLVVTVSDKVRSEK